MNKLYFGDNLTVLRDHVKDETVDLIYLDPPFNSSSTYNAFFPGVAGHKSEAQAEAFRDTWDWGPSSEEAYDEVRRAGGDLAVLLSGLRKWLGDNGMMAYLAMMAVRLLELRRVLKPTGSIYLHCDPTASHYLKLLLDSIFGRDNFRNEIHWYYYNKMHDSRKKLFAAATDTIFFNVKDVREPFTFHQLREMRDKPVRQLVRKKVGGRMVNARDEQGNILYQEKLDRGIDNVWRIPMLQPASREMMGYPTQKPASLLERIIDASSNEGDLILDPFCGCGTTIEAAENRRRRWIGIDVTHYAVTLIERRLANKHPDAVYTVHGRPTDLAGAIDLARRDKHQFQWWAAWRLGAQRYREEKVGSDRGIDGRIIYQNGPFGDGSIIISVKGGEHVGVQMVRDLRGVIEREEAEMGILITLAEPTRPMVTEAASAGFVKQSAHGRLPRIQIATVEDILEGRLPAMPRIPQEVGAAPAARPRRGRTRDRRQLELLLPIEGAKKLFEDGEFADPRFVALR